MDRRSLWLVLLAALSIAAAPEALAGPRVVVVESADRSLLPALAAQVAVHAGPAVSITTVDEPVPDAAAFAIAAPRLVARHGATLVVWVAASTGATAADRTFVVYVAGRPTDRALMELVRIRADTPASEVERTIALKVAALLDSVLATPAGAALGVAPAPPRWSIELGALAAIESGDRELVVGPELALVRSWDLERWRIAARAATRWSIKLGAPAIERAGARTEIDDIGALVGAAIERPLGRWSASASTHAGAAVLRASATDGDGRFGSATVIVPFATLGVGLQALVSGATSVRLAIDVERALIHQRFLAAGDVVTDLGRTRLRAGLVLSVPLR